MQTPINEDDLYEVRFYASIYLWVLDIRPKQKNKNI